MAFLMRYIEKTRVDLIFSTYRDGRQIGESAMIVIDTETGEFEKVEVPEAEKI